MYEDFWEDLGLPLFVICVGIGLVMAGGLWLESASCHAAATKMGFESSWGVLQDCQIKTADGWVPLKSYRKFADPK